MLGTHAVATADRMNKTGNTATLYSSVKKRRETKAAVTVLKHYPTPLKTKQIALNTLRYLKQGSHQTP